jgi:hypothetical protein
MRCICGHDEEEHTEEAGCGIGGCLCCAYRLPTKKRKGIKKLVAKLNDLQDQRNEISGEINELNAKLRQETFEEWYEGKGIDGGLLDVAYDAMITFWDAEADQVRYQARDYDRNLKPNFDPSPEQVFISCLYTLDAHLETLTSTFSVSKKKQTGMRRKFKDMSRPCRSQPVGRKIEQLTELLDGYKNVSAPVLRIVEAIHNLPEDLRQHALEKRGGPEGMWDC